jgi:glucosyl-dolichyl phosphate glucuronosyltransferase
MASPILPGRTITNSVPPASDPPIDLEISVVLCTYNRAEVLPRALERLLQQDPSNVPYEVVLVDNNSTDATRVVVDSFVARGSPELRYIFEPKQGLAHARNTGILSSKAPIIAFTDDDVMVAPDWLATIKRTFADYPEVDCIGGRVLPRWTQPPPSWLTREHWAPLALLDYGDKPFYVTASKRLCLVGANTAFRKETFGRIGLLSPHVQAIKRDGGTEDHELLLRLWRSGGQGLYTPHLLVMSEASPDRLAKGHHRRWHQRNGRFMAIMHDEGFEQTRIARVFGAPAWLYRQAIEGAVRCLGCLLGGRFDRAFLHEVKLRFSVGFLQARWREFFSQGLHKQRRLLRLLRFKRSSWH